jgi:hypothetical protein
MRPTDRTSVKFRDRRVGEALADYLRAYEQTLLPTLPGLERTLLINNARRCALQKLH